MKLFVYDHCPFCVRARMIFGVRQVPVSIEFLANDDEATPISMTGKKMLPTLQKDDGSFMPESLDIVKYIDELSGNSMDWNVRDEVETLFRQILKVDDALVVPRDVQIGLPEFATQSAIEYFSVKHEKYLNGTFDHHLSKTDEYLAELHDLLAKLEHFVGNLPYFNGENFSKEDVILFPVFRNLTMVKGVNFPPKIKTYTEQMSKLSGVYLFSERAV